MKLLSYPLLLALALSACTRPGAPGEATFPRAPVILISIDTLRSDHLPAYGYRGVETPAIDRLRRDSVLFENAYSACPLTLPSHASLLTGLPPAATGVRDNIGYRLDTAKTPTVADLLRRHGYATGAAVSAYVLRGRTGLAASFDDYEDGIEVLADRTLGLIERRGEETAARARAWIDRQHDRPFFFFLHLYEPHSPYTPPEPWKSRYAANPYDGEIATADDVVGRFLDHLRAGGLYDRAIVVLLSDHGEGLGDHGEKEHGVLLYREAIRVPLLLKLPGSRRAGERIAAPAELLDVVPTLCGLLGIAAPKALPGRPLLGLDGEPGRRIYSETFYPRLHFGWSELQSLVDARYAYIDGPDPELYDVASDPGERRNVIAEERRVFRGMKDELLTHAAAFSAPREIEQEEVAKIRALGYAAVPVQAAGPLPDPKRALPALAQVSAAYDLGARGEHAKAAALLADLVRRFPAMLDARFQLASNLAALGRYDEALAQYDRAIAIAPVAADGMLIEEGRIFLRLGRLDDAERRARAVAATLPAEAHELLARVAWARGQVAPAAAEARQAMAAEAVPRAEAVLLLGEIEVHQNQLAPALALLEPLSRRVESGERPPVAGLDFLRGDALARLSRSAEAEQAFRAEIRRFPRDARAYSHLAFLYASLRRFAEIDPLLQAMVAANPGKASCLEAAAAAEQLGDAQGAREWRRRAAAGS